ncbi:MAG: hypothetical protein KAS70_02910 [Planctomycetes bacterium]|nr:hypothetical protein [Planctomycetota bacterium]
MKATKEQLMKEWKKSARELIRVHRRITKHVSVGVLENLNQVPLFSSGEIKRDFDVFQNAREKYLKAMTKAREAIRAGKKSDKSTGLSEWPDRKSSY